VQSEIFEIREPEVLEKPAASPEGGWRADRRTRDHPVHLRGQRGRKGYREKKGKASQSKGSSKTEQRQPQDTNTIPADIDPATLLADLDPENASPEARLEKIQQSHALLQHFNSKELRTLLNLKRNTSPKAWTLREDLVVLLLPHSNREIAAILQDRNKEAVKKRLQLLRSKGLVKRVSDPSIQDS
jgi:hypothetical protein